MWSHDKKKEDVCTKIYKKKVFKYTVFFVNTQNSKSTGNFNQ